MVEVKSISIRIKFKIRLLLLITYINPILNNLLCHHPDSRHESFNVSQEVLLNLSGVLCRILVQVFYQNQRIKVYG